MAPTPREIPGYFYDTEKKKYFKIQPNHMAPAGSTYSYEALASRDHEVKQRTAKELRDQRERRERVGRDPRVKNPLTSLGGRLGSSGPGNATSAICEYYGKALTPASLFDLPSSAVDISYNQQFDVNHRTGDILIAENYLNFHGQIIKHIRRTQLPNCKIERGLAFLTGPPDVTMLITNRGIPIWAFGGGITVCELREDDIYAGVQYTIRDEHIYSLAGSPSGKFWAAASDNTIRIGSDSPESGTTLRTLVRVEKSRHEFVALSFRDENIVMAADRSNFVNFYDHRLGAKSRVWRLKHEDHINAVRTLKNDNHVLVNGLMSTMIYDLRYSTQPRTDKKRELPTSPYLTFSMGTQISDRPRLGFDYYDDLNLVAIASSQKHEHHVTLYSTRTGRVVPSPLNEYKFKQSIPCLKFASLRDGTKSVLLESTGRGFQEWSAQGQEDAR